MNELIRLHRNLSKKKNTKLTNELDENNFKSTSVFVLVVANLLPVYGVLFLDWKVFDILFLYWAETAVIGIMTILKILLSKNTLPNNRMVNYFLNIFTVGFFIIHFGAFLFGHLLFITSFPLLGYDVEMSATLVDSLRLLLGSSNYLLFGITPLAISHLYSFFVNYIGKKEYTNAVGPMEMSKPYGRVVIMHITIIVSGIFIAIFNMGIFVILILVALKILLDSKFHKREHQKVMTANSRSL